MNSKFLVFIFIWIWQMHSAIVWCTIILLGSLLFVPELQNETYSVTCAVIVVYIFFNQYPSLARRMHQRKLTYEDLEDLACPTDIELRKRFQLVFTRIQQIGGALCAGIIVMYGFHVFQSDMTLFEAFGILGGLLSLYARIFGYIGSFCITCLHNMKGHREHFSSQSVGSTTHTNPDTDKPQETKNSKYVL